MSQYALRRRRADLSIELANIQGELAAITRLELERVMPLTVDLMPGVVRLTILQEELRPLIERRRAELQGRLQRQQHELDLLPLPEETP